MTLFRLPKALFGLSALTLIAASCGPDSEANQPQDEAQENAPEGIIFVSPDQPLPPDFIIQSLTATEQSQMLTAVNNVRKKGTKCGTTSYPAATALTLNSKLVTASEGHAADMAAKNYFSHTSLDGRTFDKRITNAGYKWSTVGENIAAGYTTIQAAVDGWYASTGHCQNFMNKGFTEVGFGKGYSATATYKYYWVADLGHPL